MKKILFYSFLLIAFLFTSCQSKELQISGTIQNGDFENAQVFLSERINRIWQNIDSVNIVDNKFQMKHIVDSVRVIQLVVKNGNNEIVKMEPFVFENGKISVEIDSTSISIGGTKQNDIFNIYKKEQNKLSEKMEALYKSFISLPDELKTKEAQDSIEEKINKLDEEYTQNAVKYSLAKVNTVVGTYVFMSTFYGFTVEEKENIFSEMNTETKQISRIAELIKATEIEKKTSIGQPFVDFEMEQPNGIKLKLSELVGKSDYLLIDFWASWCGPCIRSFPELTAFYEKNRGERFNILGVSLDKEKEPWISAIEKHKLEWNHISDLQYWDSFGAKLYAVNAIPATVLIDKNGIIVGRNMKLAEIQTLLLDSQAVENKK